MSVQLSETSIRLGIQLRKIIAARRSRVRPRLTVMPIRDLAREEARRLAKCNHAVNCVSLAAGVDREDILSRRRQAVIVEARQLVMYLLTVRVGYTASAVGRFFHRDHGTVSWAIKAVQDRLDIDPKFGHDVARLSAQLARES